MRELTEGSPLKNLMPIVAAVLLATTAAACSSGDGDSGGGPVELTLWHGQDDLAAKSMEKLVDSFNKSHPGIKVKTDSGGATADTMLPKVTAAFAAGTFPDVAYMYGSWGAALARSPKVPNLKKYIGESDLNWDDFWPNSRATATVNGKVIGFPSAADDLTVLYNKKLLADAGLKPPSPTWSWNDFREMARKLTNAKDKTYGTTWAVSGGEETTWLLWPLLWQHGGSILSKDEKKAAFNSPAGVQALTLVQQMTLQDKSVYVDTSPAEKGQKLFESGRLGMFLAGPWVLPDVQAAKVDYGIAPMPGTNGDHQTVSGMDNWAVFDHGSRRVKAAVEFLTWLTKPEQQLVWMTDTGSLPTRKSITSLPGYKEYVKKYPGVDVVTENLANAKQIRPVISKYPRVSGFVAQAIAAALLGKSDPQSALNDAANKSDALLKVPGQ
ncbi:MULTISPECIES: ABC transporter substrate-binding protein [Actinomadura]|uniref:Extracellular solute-binding protein n=1 Tax=Actinomadura litoris TaxID=2678616 RepID=A0A7K1KUY2_9ACTN|nr:MULTISPECIES: ABC transporter substrate-binding protein [Actinomadura]MBT2211070.1 ABC transporter substrate-binding protein [Actinomadura sp. NEAU-AAG7]MUN35991.1 extracellular solute-binding protein [Actinomadura litoris]